MISLRYNISILVAGSGQRKVFVGVRHIPRAHSYDPHRIVRVKT